MKDNMHECGCGCGEELEKENNCGCGCGEHEEHCGCGCGDHEDDCGCEEDTILVDLEDENGETITCPVVDEFEYKDNVYALVQHPDGSAFLLREDENEDGEVILQSLEEEEFKEASNFYQNLD